MKLIKVKNYKEMSRKAADIILDEIKRKPNLALGLASGKTTLGLYKQLAKAYKKGKVDFSKIKIFTLDEYYPIKKSDKKSFYYYFFKNLLNKINVDKRNVNLLSGEARNAEKECKQYEDKIKKSRIDLQVLGLGVNGHIAFNEPGSLNSSKTRLVNLAPVTIRRGVPKRALTQGVSTILKARQMVLLASGKKKAEAVAHLLRGKEDKNWPVSFLKKHKNLIVIVDKRARGK
jgi:glucosamine-6-phosphate deaminase